MKIKNKRRYVRKVVRDPKHINVPNICFSLLSKGDSRESEYAQQRKSRGFDDSETWSLSDTIANFVVPRLKRFIEIESRTCVGSKSWDRDMQSMLTMFELVRRDKGSRIYSEKETAAINTGLNAFKRQFMALWW